MQANALRGVIEPVVASHGLELDDLAVQKAGSRSLVRVTVDGDGAEGRGPTLDDIAVASQAISRALDDSGVAGERPYVLEVSSRGVGKPLVTPAQWRRNVTRLVEVRLAAGGEPVTARIQAAGPDGVTLSDGASPIELDYTAIAQAVVQVELNRPPDGEAGSPPDPLSQESEDGH